MNPEQQKLALLEWAGWKLKPLASASPLCWHNPEGKPVAWEDQQYLLPNLSSLDVIAEMVEKVAVTHGTLWCMELRNIVVRDCEKNPLCIVDTGVVGDVYFYNANAPQRLEALVRTLGLWKE